MVSEDVFVLKSGLSFLFREPQVPQLRVRKKATLESESGTLLTHFQDFLSRNLFLNLCIKPEVWNVWFGLDVLQYIRTFFHPKFVSEGCVTCCVKGTRKENRYFTVRLTVSVDPPPYCQFCVILLVCS